MLVQAVNTMGNSMVTWFEGHPQTCLPGEVDEWMVEGSVKDQDSDHCEAYMDSVGTFGASDENLSDALMEDPFIRPYDLMSDDEKEALVSDCFQRCSISSTCPYDSQETAELDQNISWMRRRGSGMVKREETVTKVEKTSILQG